MSRRRHASRPESGGWRLSHQVRIHSIRVREGRPDPKTGKSKRTYVVRWVVETKDHQRTYATRALAEAERARLMGYQRQGCAFEVDSGLPEPLLRERHTVTWFEHVCRYIDTKWPQIAPTSRKSVADTIATVTPALLSVDHTPEPGALRQVAYRWLASAPARKAVPPPGHLEQVARWLAHNTVTMAELGSRQGAGRTRRGLELLASKLDGSPAAPNTFARRRAVFYNVLDYAVEVGQLEANPLDHVSWKTPKTVETVDRRSVVNMAQGRRLLEAVAGQGEMGERLVAFFAVMLYAALRPAEALGLRRRHLTHLPTDGWGELLLARSTPRAGTAWTDTGRSREDRGLKHRAEEDTRPVPAHPELVAIIHRHVARFGYGPHGRLIAGPYGGLIDESRYLLVWQRARAAVLTPEELESPLARRPYDLRHTAVSTWLNAGVPPTQVAEWAGHSVAVLLRVYAKCIVGQDAAARARIEEALKDDDQGKSSGS